MTDFIDRSDEYADMFNPDGTDRAHDEADANLVVARKWPTLSPTALQGTAGTIIRAIEKNTEADPAALLITLLAMFGCSVGPAPHMMASNSEHAARLWPLITGSTSAGAKGTSASTIEALMKKACPDFEFYNTSGLSSAEGLAEQVRDANGKPPEAKDYDPGVGEKRLMVTESEYAAVLSRGQREGNSLMTTLRDAWDGKPLRTLTRNNPLRATGHHIVVIGHVTPGELWAKLSKSELHGGTINRQLICLSRRARNLPDGGNIPDDILTTCAGHIKKALMAAKRQDERKRTPEANKLWHQVYGQLGADRGDGDFAAATARAIPQVLRLSLTYALIDSSSDIKLEHVQAALALWEYCEASAAWLFSDAEHNERKSKRDDLIAFIESGGTDGVTRTGINVKLYKKNANTGQIDAVLKPLIESGAVVEDTDRSKPGRPTVRYYATNLRINRINPSDQQEQVNSASRINTNYDELTPELVRNSVPPRINEQPQTPRSEGIVRKNVNSLDSDTEPLCNACELPLGPAAQGLERHHDCVPDPALFS